MPEPNIDSSHHVSLGPHKAVALVPDTDGELRVALDELLGLALSLTGSETHHDADKPSPRRDPLSTGLAAGALGRIRMALGAARRETVTPIAPDGRYELTPLLQVSVRRADLELLRAMADRLTTASMDDGGGAVTATFRGFARSVGTTPERLAARAARLHAALSLGCDDDAEPLSRCLAPCGGRVVLTAGQLDSYDKVIHRFMVAWHRSDDGRADPLAQYLYQGGRP